MTNADDLCDVIHRIQGMIEGGYEGTLEQLIGKTKLFMRAIQHARVFQAQKYESCAAEVQRNEQLNPTDYENVCRAAEFKMLVMEFETENDAGERENMQAGSQMTRLLEEKLFDI
jgi:hypothetical protein